MEKIDIPAIHQIAIEQLLDNNPVPTFVINLDHVIIHWNQACELIIGAPASQMVGTKNQWRPFYEYPRPVMADLMLDDQRGVLASQFYQGKYRNSKSIPGALEAEDYFPHFPGGGRWLFFTAAPLRDHNGVIVGAIETLQDITDQKRQRKAFTTPIINLSNGSFVARRLWQKPIPPCRKRLAG